MKTIWTILAAVGALGAAVSSLSAQPATEPPGEDAAPAEKPWSPPEANLLVTLPSDQTLTKGLLQFIVTHRFRDSVRGSNAHTLYSLDSGADFGAGFAYSPAAHMDVEIYRSGAQDDYELAAKLSTRRTGDNGLFGAALRFGGADRRDPLVVTDTGGLLSDTRARTSVFAQGVATVHLMGNRLEFSVVPSYSSRTTSETRVFNVPVHAAFALSRSWNLQAEYQPPRRKLDGSIAVWAIGIEKTLYRHRFSFVVSNSTLTAVDQTLSGDYGLALKRQQRLFDNGYRNNDWHVGFNLIRQFKVSR